jgi:hypothetical protein
MRFMALAMNRIFDYALRLHGESAMNSVPSVALIKLRS